MMITMPVGIGGNIYVSGEKTAVVNSGGINSWYKRMGNKIFHAEGLSFKKGKYTTERTLLYVLNSAYDPFVLANDANAYKGFWPCNKRSLLYRIR